MISMCGWNQPTFPTWLTFIQETASAAFFFSFFSDNHLIENVAVGIKMDCGNKLVVFDGGNQIQEKKKNLGSLLHFILTISCFDILDHVYTH